MKNSLIFLLASLVCIFNLKAQEPSVWEGDLFPKDFDNFKSGAYTSLNGDLKVYGSKIIDLAQLKSLKSVNGNVYIGINDYKSKLEEGNKYITSLNGLNNLKEISGELEIHENKLLTDLTALKKLKKVGKLNIAQNPILTSLEGLNSVSGSMPNGLEINKNKRLQNISQLSGITSVGEYIAITSNLSLQSLEGLHNIKTTIDCHIQIVSNNYLKDLKGLRSLSKVDGEVQIRLNPEIEELTGLEKITEIKKFLHIKNNDKLKNLEGLSSLKSIGEDFSITGNKALKSLNGLKKLTTIKGDLSITQNPLLSDISGVNTVKDSINRIAIYKNESLTELTGLNNIKVVKEDVVLSIDVLNKGTGFSSIKYIGGNFSINLNQVKEMNMFSNLTKVGKNMGIGTKIIVVDLRNSFEKLTHVNNNFYIRSTKTLEHFSGPDALVDIENIVVTGNEKLISLQGFNGLKTIRGGIKIEDNITLTAVEGFNSLKTINERFSIEDNPVLVSIRGFKSLEFINYLWVDDNKKLADLSGFSNLKSSNKIYLRENYSLEDLTGFSSLERVNEELDFHDNSELKSLNGLENLVYVKKLLDITGNSKLVDYNALSEQFITSKTDRDLWFSDNAYSPSKNELLIHNKLDTKVIPESYLKTKSRWGLSLLRNEIFARKGFLFKDGDIKDYFDKEGWYQPQEGIEITLNDIEEENVRLIKMYEQQRIDRAVGAINSLKKKYQNNLNFSNEYKKYYPILKKFIKSIKVNDVTKSNKLTFSVPADVEGLWMYDDTGGMKIEDTDELIIFFNYTKKTLTIRIKDNKLVEDPYERWEVNEVVDFEFIIEDDFSVEFANVTSDYN
ncbi:YARHG domain-containing protein [Cellulophaga sp. 20_2_10]|uniref:YARHG domain-containing protein n=1 Tax=Cellulophaga sp. 20_2_10 TaxID=2942476 RepID=UPI00201A9DF7|nr:YARHG domain-containing protein [Cellulophaga sp. 20_2_10]MCL5246914.1 YARHG domain-containing protein [Cellulophaga sp. 20_2_10]